MYCNFFSVYKFAYMQQVNERGCYNNLYIRKCQDLEANRHAHETTKHKSMKNG